MKTAFSDSMCQYVSVHGNITNDEGWRWAKGYDFETIESAHKDMLGFVVKSAFWSSFAVNDINSVKNLFDGETLEWATMAEFKTKVLELKRVLLQVTKAHQARMSVGKTKTARTDVGKVKKSGKAKKEDKTAATAAPVGAQAPVADID